MHVHELTLVGYADGVVAARAARLARGRTSARSPRRSEATAGAPPHGDRPVPRRGGRPGADHPARRSAREAPVTVVRDPTELAPQTARRCDRQLRRRPPRPPRRGRRGRATGLEPTVITFDPHPRIALGNKVELLTTLDRRLELLEEAGVADVLVAAFTPELQQLDAGAVRRALPAGDRRRSRRRGRGLPLRRPPLGRSRAPRAPRLRGGRRARAAGRLVDGDSRRARRRRRAGRGSECSAGRSSSTGSSSPETSAGERSATRRRTCASSRTSRARGTGSTPASGSGTAPRSRSGRTRTTAARERRIEPYLLDFDGDLYGKRLVVELWERLRDEARVRERGRARRADRARRRGDRALTEAVTR